MNNQQLFTSFLSQIDLSALRKEYKDIKIVELDMPKNVQALACIYREYWTKRKDWPNYKQFYNIYKESLARELEEWRQKTGFSKETFNRGLPARIYRTWAGLLTQIQGAYVAETVYGEGRVEMGVSIDQSGKDLVIDLGKRIGRMPVQIKKKSYRPEARRKTSPKHEFIKLVYEVPPGPRLTKKGRESIPYKRWHDKWKNKLKVLPNEFVVFKREAFVFKNLWQGKIE